MATKNHRVKIIIVGDGNVGKSSFLHRWETDTFRGGTGTYGHESVSNSNSSDVCHKHNLYYRAELTVDGKIVSTSAWYLGKFNFD